LAALGVRLGVFVIGKWARMQSSPGIGATAVRTTSSKRSNSTSLMATSTWGRTVANFFLFRIELVAQIISIRRSRF
jgi:hypothetical protein